MKLTVLERILTTERYRRQADISTGAGFAIPSMAERPLNVDQEPLVVTNMRGTFVPTRVSRVTGLARYGFSECLPEDEPVLLGELWRVLWALSVEQGWSNRCKNVAEAVGSMRGHGMEPRSVVVPYSLLEAFGTQTLSKQEADDLMVAQGYITNTEGVQVLAADLPVGKALVTALPALTGYYTRVDDRVGVMLLQTNQTLYLVDEVA